jgi:uncharacterized membrane protein
MGWSDFLAALAAFFVSHAIFARPATRAAGVAALGERGFLIGYSLLSTALFAWAIVAAGRAPYVALWAPAPWQAWAPFLAMPLATALAALGVGAPNPLSFGGAHAERFDPERPGVAGLARHPILWAMALWAGAHLVPNGDLAHVILFGGSLGFAVLGMRALDARLKRRLGAREWARLARLSSTYPLQAWLDGRRPAYGPFPARRLIAAAATLAALLGAHHAVIGVSPWPF